MALTEKELADRDSRAVQTALDNIVAVVSHLPKEYRQRAFEMLLEKALSNVTWFGNIAWTTPWEVEAKQSKPGAIGIPR